MQSKERRNYICDFHLRLNMVNLHAVCSCDCAVHVCKTRVHMCPCVWRSGTALGLTPLVSCTFGKAGLSLAWCVLMDEAVQPVAPPPCLPACPRPGAMCVHHYTQHFPCGFGFGHTTEAFMFAQQALYPLCHFPRSMDTLNNNKSYDSNYISFQSMCDQNVLTISSWWGENSH